MYSLYLIGEVGITPQLDGIAYYEAKDIRGIDGASMAGGTEIVFYGKGMSHSPSSISAIYTNDIFGVNDAGLPRPCKYPKNIIIFLTKSWALD